MDENDMAPATGAVPTHVAKVATEHLSYSIDSSIVRQREKDYLAGMAAVVGAATGLIGAIMLVGYVIGGRW